MTNEEKIDRMQADVSDIKARLASIDAHLTNGQQRHATEIQVLFAKSEKHDERINALERDYTPERDHRELVEKFTALKDVVSRIAVYASAISAAGTAILTGLVNWLVK